MTVSREIITGKINEHDMFCILFRVFTQVFCSFTILFGITCSFSRPCNGVDICTIPFNATVRFW